MKNVCNNCGSDMVLLERHWCEECGCEVEIVNEKQYSDADEPETVPTKDGVDVDYIIDGVKMIKRERISKYSDYLNGRKFTILRPYTIGLIPCYKCEVQGLGGVELIFAPHHIFSNYKP